MGSHNAILKHDPDGGVGGEKFERKPDPCRNAEIGNGGRLVCGGVDVSGGVPRPDAQPDLLRIIRRSGIGDKLDPYGIVHCIVEVFTHGFGGKMELFPILP